MNSKQLTKLASIITSNLSPLAKVKELELFIDNLPMGETVEIRTKGVCDFCTDAMTYAGTNDGIVIIRACMACLDRAQNKLDALRENRIKL